jgi:hypothetical protein
MNQKIFLPVAIGTIILFLFLQSNLSVSGQQGDASQNETAKVNSNIGYVQTALQLLNQTKVEYTNGNYSAADDLVTTAYLNNFEYVEIPLMNKGAQDLKDNIEDMMRKDLRQMIKDHVPEHQVDMQIDKIDTKLVEAISILNETK